LDNCPLPRSQFQNLGAPVDWSWNTTVRGEHPETLLAVKFATGAWAPEFNELQKRSTETTYRNSCPFPGNGALHFFPALVSRGRVSLYINQSGFVIRYRIIL
jgi:hypothetical protein